MHRYALFSGGDTRGGWKDFIATHDDIDNLKQFVEHALEKRKSHKYYLAKNDDTWWHIVDLTTGQVIEDERGRVNISTEVWIERG